MFALILGLAAPQALGQGLKITATRAQTRQSEDADYPTTRIHVSGTADLPDGTRLWLQVIYGPYQRSFLREPLTVKDKKFAREMGPYAGKLFPDRYGVRVSFQPTQQHPRLAGALAGKQMMNARASLDHQLNKRPAARAAEVARVSAMLADLKKLLGPMAKQIVQLRALDKAGKFPKGKARSAWEKWGNLWDFRYDKLREANDEASNEYMLRPFVSTDKGIQRVINYLLDFQYEYKSLIKQDKESFAVSRSVRTLAMLQFQAESWFRFERILLSAEPAKAVREEIVRLGRLWQADAGRPLPSADQVSAALAKLERFEADGRRLGLYRLMLDRDERRKLAEEIFADEKVDAIWVGRVNHWLHDLRNADWEFRNEAERELAGLPGATDAARALQTASLLELARLIGKRMPPLTGAELTTAQLPAWPALIDRLIERYGLARIRVQAIRRQTALLARMLGELGKRAKQAAGQRAFDAHKWTRWSQVFDSQLLRLNMMELPPLGKLSGDAAQTRQFSALQSEMRFLVTRAMALKAELELALAGEGREAAAGPLLERLVALRAEASTMAGKIR